MEMCTDSERFTKVLQRHLVKVNDKSVLKHVKSDHQP